MDFTTKHCVPCEGGIPPLPDDKEDEYMKDIPKWILVRNPSSNGNQTLVHKIRRLFSFKNFNEAIQFVNKVATLAESEGHHPDIKIVYAKVEIELYTHAVGGLSENDFIVAAKIDQI